MLSSGKSPLLVRRREDSATSEGVAKANLRGDFNVDRMFGQEAGGAPTQTSGHQMENTLCFSTFIS